MEAAVAGEVQGLAEQHYTTGAAEPAEPVERAPLHSHDTVHRAGCADIDVDEEAVGHVEAGHSGVDHVDHVVQHVVQGLAHLHVGEREERSEEAGKVCGAVDCDQQGLHEAQHQGDESVEGCRRLSGAPLGLEVKEEDACQSRGVAAAVREGLVEANTVLDCLREYVKVVCCAIACAVACAVACACACVCMSSTRWTDFRSGVMPAVCVASSLHISRSTCVGPNVGGKSA
jgi:hypothetical protein